MSNSVLKVPSLELKLDKNQINSLVQQYIAQCYKKSDIEQRIYQYATQRISKKVDMMFSDGTIFESISKRLVKEVPLTEIISLVNKEDFNEAIKERVTKHLISKLGL